MNDRVSLASILGPSVGDVEETLACPTCRSTHLRPGRVDNTSWGRDLALIVGLTCTRGHHFGVMFRTEAGGQVVVSILLHMVAQTPRP